MCFLKNYKTMSEWKQKHPTPSTPHRELIHLCVIDDEGFEKDSMSRLKFMDIRVMDTFEDINDFENYNVILCDIKGIGKDLDEKLEGIAVAREIKKIYPDKIVLQYSGQAVQEFDPLFYQNMTIDGFIEKSLSTKKLADELDKNCAMLWDPISAWEYIERHLRTLNIDNKNIAYLENLFVKSLEKKKNFLSDCEKNEKLTKILDIGVRLVHLGIEVLNCYMMSN